MQNIPIFLPLPVTLLAEQWHARAKECESLSFRELCALAQVRVRVSGPAAERDIHFAGEKGVDARVVGQPFSAMLAIEKPTSQSEALQALGRLAYAFNDYGTRESACGRGLFTPSVGAGRRHTGKAKSGAERVRAYRLRQKQ